MDPKIKLALAFAALATTSCDRASREGTPINSPSEDIFKTDQNKRGPIPIEQKFDAVHLVSHVAKCAEVKTSGVNLLQEKSELQSWDCSSEKTSQQWFYNAETREFVRRQLSWPVGDNYDGRLGVFNSSGSYLL